VIAIPEQQHPTLPLLNLVGLAKGSFEVTDHGLSHTSGYNKVGKDEQLVIITEDEAIYEGVCSVKLRDRAAKARSELTLNISEFDCHDELAFTDNLPRVIRWD